MPMLFGDQTREEFDGEAAESVYSLIPPRMNPEQMEEMPAILT